MRLAIALIVAGWRLPTLAAQPYEYEFGGSRYCGNYHDSLTRKILPSPDRPGQSANRSECQKACDDHANCSGYIMSCAVDCYLMETCEEMLVSSCYSYVGVKKNLSPDVKNSFLIDPWDSPSFTHAGWIALAATAVYACVFARTLSRRVSETGEASGVPSEEGTEKPSQEGTKSCSDFFASEPASKSDDQTSESWEDHFHEKWWRCRLQCCIFLAAIALPILIAQMWFFPNDGDRPRGVCGVVHGNYTPYQFWELLPGIGTSDTHLLVNDTLYRAPSLHALPDSCTSVYNTDIVCWKSGPDCHDWCKKIAGSFSFRFLCSAPTYGIGHIYMACNKVYVWDKVKSLPLCTAVYCALLYGCLSFVHAAWHAHRKIVDLERSQCTEVTNVPSTTDFSIRAGAHHKVLFRLANRCPCIPTKSDAGVLKVQMWTALAGFLADPVGDLNGCILFLLRGEFLYSGFLMLVAMIPNLHNPLQSDGTKACLLSLHRGFPTREMYVLQAREGASEGIYSLLLAVFILMRGAYFHSFGTVWHFVGITFIAATSIISALPHAGAASVLLQMHSDPADYNDCYVIEATKKKQYWMRVIPIIDGLALTVAFGRTFCNLRLALYLWAMGFGIGAGGSMLHACYCRSKFPYQVISAFFFWPFAPVRLIVLRSVWVDMTKGQASSWELVSRGCASLPPFIFYVHRWLTLSAFWAFTVVRPDRCVYTDILSDVFTRYNESMEQSCYLTRLKILLGAIFIVGWVSLPLSVALYWYFRDLLEGAYKNVRDGAFDLDPSTHKLLSQRAVYATPEQENYTKLPLQPQDTGQELSQEKQQSLFACCTRSARGKPVT